MINYLTETLKKLNNHLAKPLFIVFKKFIKKAGLQSPACFY